MTVRNNRPYRLLILGIIFVVFNAMLFSSFDVFHLRSEDMVEKASFVLAHAVHKFKPYQAHYIVFEVANLDGIEGHTGTFTVQLHPYFARNGVRRFEELTDESFWNGCRFFRATPGFGVQFGINGDPITQQRWQSNTIEADKPMVSNIRRTLVFAQSSGPNSRTTQIIINTAKNSHLDDEGYSPIGEVAYGMDIVDRIFSGYEDGSPVVGEQQVPDQERLSIEGNVYLEQEFPKLTYIRRAYFK